MNMEKLVELYNTGSYVMRRIGGRNIIFFGLLGAAMGSQYLYVYSDCSSMRALSLTTVFTFSRGSSLPRQSMNIHTDHSNKLN